MSLTVSASISGTPVGNALLTKYNKNDSLIKHALAVEGGMRYCARRRGEDEEKWGVIGLIHDLDYEPIIMGMRNVAEEIGLKGD